MAQTPMLTPEEAQDIVLDHIRPLGVERVSLLEGLQRVLARDLAARRDNPLEDNSAMDGYAVRWADTKDASAEAPVRLEVVEEIPAGHLPQKEVGPGQASRIMTGGVVPAGADTVLMQEDTRPAEGGVEILEGDELHANIRRRGEDVFAGAELVRAGTQLGPGELAVLASQQHSFVPVYRRPVLAIFSTGDELVEIDQPAGPGQVVNGNTYGLAALVKAHGGIPLMLPITPDDREATRQTVEEALNADFILSSGGVSVGEYDYVKQVLDQMGAEPKLWRVAMKPGKPLFFCTIEGTPYFGLPGNPVSSLMSFLQFVRPALRKAAGFAAGQWLLPEVEAVAETPLANRGDRRQYMRAQVRFVDGRFRAAVQGDQGSHILTSMLGANGVVVLEPNCASQPGDSVRVQLLERVV